MVTQSKPNVKPAATGVKEVKKATTDENDLDKIMSQISELQEGINASTAQKQPEPAAVPRPAAVNAAPTKTATPDIKRQVAAAFPSPTPEAEPPQEEPVDHHEADSLNQAVEQVDTGDLSEPWLEETLAQLNKSEEEKTGETGDVTSSLGDITSSIPLGEGASEPLNHESDDSQWDDSDQNGQLMMTIRGKMQLQLKYGMEQYVSLSFNGSALQVKLSDGMEIKIPARTKGLKKAA